jgi:hypothetical protein
LPTRFERFKDPRIVQVAKLFAEALEVAKGPLIDNADQPSQFQQ